MAKFDSTLRQLQDDEKKAHGNAKRDLHNYLNDIEDVKTLRRKIREEALRFRERAERQEALELEKIVKKEQSNEQARLAKLEEKEKQMKRLEEDDKIRQREDRKRQLQEEKAA